MKPIRYFVLVLWILWSLCYALIAEWLLPDERSTYLTMYILGTVMVWTIVITSFISNDKE